LQIINTSKLCRNQIEQFVDILSTWEKLRKPITFILLRKEKGFAEESKKLTRSEDDFVGLSK